MLLMLTPLLLPIYHNIVTVYRNQANIESQRLMYVSVHEANLLGNFLSLSDKANLEFPTHWAHKQFLSIGRQYALLHPLIAPIAIPIAGYG